MLTPEILNTALLTIFREHMVEAELVNDHVLLKAVGVRANAAIIQEFKVGLQVTMQLGIQLEIPDGRSILESFVGVGDDQQTAFVDAIGHFCKNTLHVVLAAFCPPTETGVTIEPWIIAGETRQAILGDVVMRGKVPAESDRLTECINTLINAIQSSSFGSELQWFRLYYAHQSGKSAAIEVLHNNEPDQQLMDVMSKIPWPSALDFYSVRCFLVIMPGSVVAITPLMAVSRCARMAASKPELDDEQLCDAMELSGVPADQAWRAIHMLESAFVRVLFQKESIEFAADYYFIGENGEVVETGKIEDEPYFATANTVLPEFAPTPAFGRFAMASADLNAINDLLNKGAKLDGVSTAPVCVMEDSSSERAIETVRRIQTEYFAALRAAAAAAQPAAAKKAAPWWKRWR